MFQHVLHTLVDKTVIYFSVKDDAVRTCFVLTFLDSIVLYFSCFMKVAIICFVVILVGQCLNTELYIIDIPDLHFEDKSRYIEHVCYFTRILNLEQTLANGNSIFDAQRPCSYSYIKSSTCTFLLLSLIKYLQ